MKKYKPDSILSISNQTREWLESDSVTLPEDIGIICIDTPNYGHKWVGLDQNYELVGKMAVRRLSDLLNRSASGREEKRRTEREAHGHRNGKDGRGLLYSDSSCCCGIDLLHRERQRQIQ